MINTCTKFEFNPSTSWGSYARHRHNLLHGARSTTDIKPWHKHTTGELKKIQIHFSKQWKKKDCGYIINMEHMIHTYTYAHTNIHVQTHIHTYIVYINTVTYMHMYIHMNTYTYYTHNKNKKKIVAVLCLFTYITVRY